MSKFLRASSKLHASLALEWNIKILILSGFLSSMGYVLWYPLISLYIVELFPSRTEAIAFLGVILTVSSLSLNLSAAPGGYLIDLYGRKRVMVLSQIIATVASFFMTLTSGSWMLIPLAVSFMGYSIMQVAAQTLIADSVLAHSRGTAYSVLDLSLTTANIIGPAIGGFVGEYFDFRKVFLVSTVCWALSIAVTQRGVKETHKAIKEETPTRKGKSFSLSYLKSIIRVERSLVALIVASAVGYAGSSLTDNIWPVYAKDFMYLSKAQVGIIVSFYTLFFAILMIPAGKISDKWRRKPLITSGLFFSGALYAIFVSLHTFYEVLTLFLFWGLASALWFTPRQALLADLTSRENRATAIGLVTTLRGILAIPAPLIGTILWTFYEPQIPFYLSALLLLLCGLLVLFSVKEPIKEKK